MKGKKKPLQGLSIRDEENKKYKVKKQNQTNQKTRCKHLLRLCPFPLLQVLWLRQGLPPLNSPDNFIFWAPPLWTRASCVFQSSWRAWQANSTDRSVPSLTTWSHTSSPSLRLYPDTASEGPWRVTLQWHGEAISTLHVCREGPGFLWNGRHFQSEDSRQPHLPHQPAQDRDSRVESMNSGAQLPEFKS